MPSVLKMSVFTMVFLCSLLGCQKRQGNGASTSNLCPIYPSDNLWNTDISGFEIHANSSGYLARLGATWDLQIVQNLPINVINSVVDGISDVEVTFNPVGASPILMPIPPDAVYHIKQSNKLVLDDNHMTLLDNADCKLYELWGVNGPNSDGSWSVTSGVIFDLTTNDLLPDGSVTATASGLPVFVGLARVQEMIDGVINHALSIPATFTHEGFFRPAISFQSDSVFEAKFPLSCAQPTYAFLSLCAQVDANTFQINHPDNIPMGLRVRLKADFDISTYSREAKILLEAAKKYGLMVTDGSGQSGLLRGEKVAVGDTYVWPTDINRQLTNVPITAFEVVDTGTLLP